MPVCNNGKRVMIKLLQTVLYVISHIFNLNMDKWIPVSGKYRSGIESLGINMYLIPVWYQSLGIRLPKVEFLWVNGWLTGPPGFGASHFRYKTTFIKLFYPILFKMMLPHKTTMKFFLKNR